MGMSDDDDDDAEGLLGAVGHVHSLLRSAIFALWVIVALLLWIAIKY